MKARRVAAVAVVLGLVVLVQALAAGAQKPVATLRLGQNRTFSATQLPTGATIACVGNGKRIVMTVPKHGAIPKLGSSMKITWVRGAHLSLSSNGHGTFFVACV